MNNLSQMEEAKNRFYSLMVVGSNPDEMVKKYDSKLEVEPYIKYYYKDAGKLKKKAIKLMQDVVDNSDKVDLTDIMIDYLKDRIKNLKSMSDFEYYTSLTGELTYNENGDAVSTENPNGRYETCRIGRNLCIPLKLKNGDEVFTAKVKDVDWDKMHMVNKELYRIAWDLFHGKRKPQNSQEEQIYENIKNQKKYFNGFDCVENYIGYNCSYWNYAYLDKNGWVDASDYKNYEWITSFYKKFVTKLNPEDIITIYECSK